MGLGPPFEMAKSLFLSQYKHGGAYNLAIFVARLQLIVSWNDLINDARMKGVTQYFLNRAQFNVFRNWGLVVDINFQNLMVLVYYVMKLTCCYMIKNLKNQISHGRLDRNISSFGGPGREFCVGPRICAKATTTANHVTANRLAGKSSAFGPTGPGGFSNRRGPPGGYGNRYNLGYGGMGGEKSILVLVVKQIDKPHLRIVILSIHLHQWVQCMVYKYLHQQSTFLLVVSKRISFRTGGEKISSIR